MSPGDGSAFDGAEEHYAEHRPAYGDRAIRYLRERFDLDAHRVLDLGCGTGQIALAMAPHVDAVVGMDPNETMLAHARRAADAAGIENVEWRRGTDRDVDERLGTVRLTTVGRAFHRMDGAATLARIADVTDPGGGVAILTDQEWLVRGTEAWQDEVYAIAGEYVEDLPERTGPVTYDDPWDELLRDCGYVDVETEQVPFEREWTVEGAIGYVLSLSFCSPTVLGDDEDAFVADVRDRLTEFGGPFEQEGEIEIVSGRVSSDRQTKE